MSIQRMLIDATQSEEIRVALTRGHRLFDLDVQTGKPTTKSNIYKAKIARIEPSLNAIFVDYGSERHGFLPLKEVAPQYLGGRPGADMRQSLREGQEILVQVEKEERGNKGAAVTTYVTLAGCYLVLMPNNTNAGGISRRIEGEERQALKNALNDLDVPKDMSVIIRTAGLGRTAEELQWDLNTLLKLWDAIQKAFETREAPVLVYQESDVILRSVRDYLRQDITEIVLDNEQVYNRVLQYVKQFRPDFVSRLHFYRDPIPLFTKYRIESQIQTVYQREVSLPQGGAIVIDRTEALTSIDVNSARATRAEDIEATALQTNLEAAEEVARQLRLRDLGGLIVIDFIDMTDSTSKTKVEECLADALKQDRARVQVGQISRFGLLEMSRQRIRPSLAEGIETLCPRCEGQGMIRDVQSLAVSMIRLIKDQIVKPETTEIILQLPLSVATYLLNEKRLQLQELEKEYSVRVLVIPAAHLETPHYELKRRTHKNLEESFNFLSRPTPVELTAHTAATPEPLVKNMVVEAAPRPVQKSVGLFSRLRQALFASNDVAPSVLPVKPEKTSESTRARPVEAQRERRERRVPDKKATVRGSDVGASTAAKQGQSREGVRTNRQRPPPRTSYRQTS